MSAHCHLQRGRTNLGPSPLPGYLFSLSWLEFTILDLQDMPVSAEIAQKVQDFEIWGQDRGTNGDEGGTEKTGNQVKRSFLKLFEEKVHQQKASSQRQK